MAIIDNPGAGGGGGGSVDETSALQYMLNHKTNYTGIAAGLTSLVTFPIFTQPSGVQNYEHMCDGCSSLTTSPANSPASSRNFYHSAFRSCTSLTNASAFSLRKASTCAYMFYNCTSLVTPPSLLYEADSTLKSSLEGCSYMFYNCTNLAAIDIGTSSNNPFYGTNMMQAAFYGCSSLKTINSTNTLRTTSCYNFVNAFYQSGIESITLNIANVSGKEISATRMFFQCTSLQSFKVATNGVTYLADTSYMFNGCTALTSVAGTFTNSTNAAFMFSGCTALKTLSATFGTGLKSIWHMFQNCTSLTSMPSINTANVTEFSSAFIGCSAMTSARTLNMASAIYLNDMVNGCTSLSNTALNNILASLLTATSYTGTKTLAYIGLTSAQATTCTGLSNWSALSAAGWTTGY